MLTGQSPYYARRSAYYGTVPLFAGVSTLKHAYGRASNAAPDLSCSFSMSMWKYRIWSIFTDVPSIAAVHLLDFSRCGTHNEFRLNQHTGTDDFRKRPGYAS